jgi:hypothetical protein
MEYQVQIHHPGDREIPELTIDAGSPAAAAEMALERVREGAEHLEAIFGSPRVLRPREALETAIVEAVTEEVGACALIDPPEPPCTGPRHEWGDVEGEPPSDSRRMCWTCGLIREQTEEGLIRYTGHQLRQPTTNIMHDATASMLLNHRACGARVDDEEWIAAVAAWLTESWDGESWRLYLEDGSTLSDEDERLLHEAVLDLDLPRVLDLEIEDITEQVREAIADLAPPRWEWIDPIPEWLDEHSAPSIVNRLTGILEEAEKLYEERRYQDAADRLTEYLDAFGDWIDCPEFTGGKREAKRAWRSALAVVDRAREANPMLDDGGIDGIPSEDLAPVPRRVGGEE